MKSITETIKPGFITDGGEALLLFAFSRDILIGKQIKSLAWN